MRRGFTLIELALAISVVGLVTAIAIPPLMSRLDAVTTDTAARRLVSAHFRARMEAILRNRIVLLLVRSDSVVISAVQSGDTAVVWREAGPAAEGVQLAGPARRLIFSPVGITMGVSNATFRLSRGAAAREVVASRLGRVRIVRR